MATIPRTLPASWYRSSPLYELEKRAVFRRVWYLLGPIIKFESGAVVEYEIAGVSLTVRRALDSQNARDIKVTADTDVRCRRSNGLLGSRLRYITGSSTTQSFDSNWIALYHDLGRCSNFR